MNCKNCNTPLPKHQTKCPNCGTENIPENQTQQEPEYISAAGAERAVPKGFSSKKNMIIIIAAAIVLIVGGVTAVAVGTNGFDFSGVRTTLQLADRYLSEQNYEQAIIEFEKVLEIEPMNVDAYLGLAEAYMALGETDKAVRILEEGIEKTGSDKLKDKLEEIRGSLKPVTTEDGAIVTVTVTASAPAETSAVTTVEATTAAETTVAETIAAEIELESVEATTTVKTELITTIAETKPVVTTFTETKPAVTTENSEDNTLDTEKYIPDNALNWNGHYYAIFDNCATWEEAKEYCESLGGHLATITSSEENSAVFSYMQSSLYQSAYFGFSDNKEEGNWYWVTGESVSYTNWHANEPNAESSKEDYAMYYYKFSDGTWNDGDFGGGTVNGGVAFICEWD